MLSNCHVRALSVAAIALAAVVVGTGCDTKPSPKPVRMQAEANLPKSGYVSTARPGAVVVPALDSTPRVVYDPLLVPMSPAIRPFEVWTEQQAAADALGRIGGAAVPHLIQALRSRDGQVRKQAAEVLARMGSEAREAVPDLIRLLDDEDESIRKTAARTLGRIGPDAAEAIPALMRNLQQPAPQPPTQN